MGAAHVTGPTKNTRREVAIRDDGACVKCGVTVVDPITMTPFRQYSIQHRAARGMGGSRDPKINASPNLLMLCGTGVTECHGDVEQHREQGRRHGFSIASREDPELVPVLNWTQGAAFLSASSGWWPVGTDYRGTDYLEHVAAERGVPKDSAEYLRLASVILDGLQRLNGPAALERDLDADEAEVVENAWDREWGL